MVFILFLKQAFGILFWNALWDPRVLFNLALRSPHLEKRASHFAGNLFLYPYLSRLMTKPTKWHVRPAKTQVSLGIHLVWSESSLSTWRKLRSLVTYWAHSEDSDLCLCLAHRSSCWFCQEAAPFVIFMFLCSPWERRAVIFDYGTLWSFLLVSEQDLEPGR